MCILSDHLHKIRRGWVWVFCLYVFVGEMELRRNTEITQYVGRLVFEYYSSVSARFER
jgi:hypothetical protein